MTTSMNEWESVRILFVIIINLGSTSGAWETIEIKKCIIYNEGMSVDQYKIKFISATRMEYYY